jgi:hypothetical protein
MFGLFKKEDFSNMPKEIRPVLKLAFPGGEKQLNQETKGLLESFPDLFTLESSQGLVVWVKVKWVTNSSSPDSHLSFQDMCKAINRHENNRLTNEQCAAIYSKILEQDFATRNKI